MRRDIPAAALDAVADALEYPHAGSAAAARAAANTLDGVDVLASTAFAALADWLDATPGWQQEEQYTRMFDLKPACTLHVGYHVWGEAYQRGALLAGLVGELRTAGVDLGCELPDFLPTLLRLWARVDLDDEDMALFHDRVLCVGIERMSRELRRVEAPWAAAVCALVRLFPQPPEVEREMTQAERNWEALHA